MSLGFFELDLAGNAIELGASREEILEVFQLAALMGLEGIVIAGEAMFGGDAPAPE